MIKLTSFYPFSNFLRVTQEFHDDKVIVKAKSLTFEQETEFAYSEVAEISDSCYASNGQMTFSFWLLLFIGFALTAFRSVIYANLILLRCTQILYICGILLFITSFIKSWHITLSDKDDNILTGIKQTRYNRGLVLKAIETVKSKSENIQEIRVANPFPETKPTFEYIYFNISNLEKTTDKYYENEIIGFEKNLFSETAYKVKYNVLSGKIYKGKMGNSIWASVLAIMVLVLSVMNGFFWGFGIHSGKILLYTTYAFLITLAISWLAQFVKREVIGIYDKKGNIEYWAYINRANKESFEKIIEFVQSRIPAENKEVAIK